jgi:MoxR-like ATPase
MTERLEQLHGSLETARTEVRKVILGQEAALDAALTVILTRQHALIEGVPGVAKTLLARTLAHVLGCEFARIQFTPDLMPADITGTNVFNFERNQFTLVRGPVFTSFLLADEINRAPAKTQSALLEAMQERTVTTGTETHHLEPPFLVMATQNPIEMEGTYPLPEAQLDRFLMKILVQYPSRSDLSTIVERTIQRDETILDAVLNREEILGLRGVCHQVLVAPHVQEYAIDMVMATQPGGKQAHELANKFIRYGSSPRGAQALVECGRVLALMKGRLHISTEDVETVAPAVLRHRIILNFDAHAEGQTPETILSKIIASVGAAVH